MDHPTHEIIGNVQLSIEITPLLPHPIKKNGEGQYIIRTLRLSIVLFFVSALEVSHAAFNDRHVLFSIDIEIKTLFYPLNMTHFP